MQNFSSQATGGEVYEGKRANEIAASERLHKSRKSSNSADPPTVTITSGGYSADISLHGGQLLRLKAGEYDIVVPANAAKGAFAGSVLAPWPNRIAGATYSHQGQEYVLPVNEETTSSRLHGLLFDVDLTVTTQTNSEAQLRGRLEASAGYPFPLDITVTYQVAADRGLSCTLHARYEPDSDSAPPIPAPFGAGFHPYLTAAGANLDECRLQLPAHTVAVTKPNGQVITRQRVEGPFDLTDGPLLADRQIDHAFTDLPAGGWMAELTHEPTGFSVRLSADTGWAQVYTAESIDRSGVAVEPQTCPPDAFNSGSDLKLLQPGESFHIGYAIEANSVE